MNTHAPAYPLPWTMGRGSFGTPLIVTKEGDSIATVDLIQNAAFIVNACNAHADLLAALQAAEKWMTHTGSANAPIQAARSAIARATGEQK